MECSPRNEYAINTICNLSNTMNIIKSISHDEVSFKRLINIRELNTIQADKMRIISRHYTKLKHKLIDWYNNIINQIRNQLSKYNLEIHFHLSIMDTEEYRIKIIRSKIRIMKQFYNYIMKYYTWASTDIYNMYTLYMNEYDKYDMYKCMNYMDIIYSDFCQKNYSSDINDERSIFYNIYIRNSNYPFLLDYLDISLVYTMECIIPDTDISVFEFLFLNLTMIHLPILNHEELMVEKCNKIEHLIRGRCKKLKEVYEIHLIFNEKCPNFPEDCTNHILKYCEL